MSLLSRPRRKACAFALAAAGLVAAALPAHAQGELTLYTTREPGLIQPLIAAFSAQTQIKVNTVFVKDGLVKQVGQARTLRTPLAEIFKCIFLGLCTAECLDPILRPHIRSAFLPNRVARRRDGIA